MNVVSSLALVAAVGWLAGCSTIPDSQIANVPLNATQENAGHIAQATVIPGSGETQFWVYVAGVPQGSSLPGRLTSYLYTGSCQSLGATPAYDMNQGPNGRFYTYQSSQYFWKSAPISTEALRAGKYVLVVRENSADGNQNIYCGNLG
ncbi:hypothetical protein D9M73_162060 [compost metagenome]